MSLSVIDSKCVERLDLVMGQIGATSGDLERLLDNPRLVARILGVDPFLSNPMTLMVDYCLRISSMINAQNYGRVDSRKFGRWGFSLSSLSGLQRFSTKFFSWEEQISSDRARSLIEADGWTAAGVEHLIVLSREKLWSERSVVALGQAGKKQLASLTYPEQGLPNLVAESNLAVYGGKDLFLAVKLAE